MMSSGIVDSFELELSLEVIPRSEDDEPRMDETIAMPHPPQNRSFLPFTKPQMQRGSSADPQPPQ
jgi:hypothetical protein